MTPHDVGLAHLLGAAQLSGAWPEQLVLHGVQPALMVIGTELSAPVAAALEPLVDDIAAELTLWGVAFAPAVESAACAKPSRPDRRVLRPRTFPCPGWALPVRRWFAEDSRWSGSALSRSATTLGLDPRSGFAISRVDEEEALAYTPCGCSSSWGYASTSRSSRS